MSRSTLGRLRWVWFQLHLWVGVALSVLLIPVSLSGSYLVWRDEFDRLLYPARTDVADPEVKLPASAYLAAAQAAFGDRATAATLRLPSQAGQPVIVSGPLGPPDRGEARGERRREGGEGAARPQRPRGNLSAWIDPGTGKVLATANPRAGIMIFMHDLHGSVFVSGGVGRKIVGWLGWAMLGSCLTGLWLWWPKGRLANGFRWKRSPDTLLNLHYLVGFWVAIPLAVLSLTGALISFPQTTRALVGAVQPLTPQPPRAQAGPPRGPASPLARPMLAPDQAMQAALQLQGGRLVSLNLPTRAAPAWRAEVAPLGGGRPIQITVDDATGAAERVAPPKAQPAGDQTIRFNRRLHDGVGFPMLWRVVITVAGLIPAILGVTGVIVWAQRQLRKAAMRRRIADPVPAE